MTTFSTDDSARERQLLHDRDYIQHHFIASLAEISDDYLIFKGGTLLRVCGLLDRFSEDLDFDYFGDLDTLWTTLLKATKRTRQRTGYPLTLERAGGNYAVASLRWGDHPSQAVRIDVNTDGRSPLPTRQWPIQPRHEGLPSGVTIRGHTLESVAVTKLACIARRRKSRDFYDLVKLLDAGVDLHRVWPAYVQHVDRLRRLGYKQPDPIPTFNSYHGALRMLTQQWEQLRPTGLIPNAPAFGDLLARIDPAVGAALRAWTETLTTDEIADRRATPARLEPPDSPAGLAL